MGRLKQQKLSPSPTLPIMTPGTLGNYSHSKSWGLYGALLHAGHSAKCPPSALTFHPLTPAEVGPFGPTMEKGARAQNLPGVPQPSVVG